MKTYETSVTVEEQGRIIVADVPFPPGTEVDVTITPTQTVGTRPSSRHPTVLRGSSLL